MYSFIRGMNCLIVRDPTAPLDRRRGRGACRTSGLHAVTPLQGSVHPLFQKYLMYRISGSSSQGRDPKEPLKIMPKENLGLCAKHVFHTCIVFILLSFLLYLYYVKVYFTYLFLFLDLTHCCVVLLTIKGTIKIKLILLYLIYHNI